MEDHNNRLPPNEPSQRNHYINHVVLFEENSILRPPECLEASGVKSVWGEVSQESSKIRKIGKNRPINRPLIGP